MKFGLECFGLAHYIPIWGVYKIIMLVSASPVRTRPMTAGRWTWMMYLRPIWGGHKCHPKEAHHVPIWSGIPSWLLSSGSRWVVFQSVGRCELCGIMGVGYSAISRFQHLTTSQLGSHRRFSSGECGDLRAEARNSGRKKW